MTIPAENFLKELQAQVGNQLKLTINNNRCTMLSVKWEPHCTRVSLHRMFLDAPKNVVEELTGYLRGKQKSLPKTVKAFIHSQIRQLNYSHLIDPAKLSKKGQYYDLDAIYTELNNKFFQDRLKLSITWFGTRVAKHRARCTLGLFYDPLKLIKINRVLDTEEVPKYVVEYVVYHEMLHDAFPAYIDEKGLTRIHNPEFKEQEERFPAYRDAQAWIKDNPLRLFLP